MGPRAREQGEPRTDFHVAPAFRVHPDAHKTQVRQAVEELFGVKVQAVNMLKVQAKPKRRGLIRGEKPGWKKAIVQLRQGETIEIFEGAQA
jgi:large subunit ribosomal protein L23